MKILKSSIAWGFFIALFIILVSIIKHDLLFYAKISALTGAGFIILAAVFSGTHHGKNQNGQDQGYGDGLQSLESKQPSLRNSEGCL